MSTNTKYRPDVTKTFEKTEILGVQLISLCFIGPNKIARNQKIQKICSFSKIYELIFVHVEFFHSYMENYSIFFIKCEKYFFLEYFASSFLIESNRTQ